MDAAELAAIRDNVERAAKTLDEMIEEVSQEMFLAEATAYLYAEQPELQMAEAVRSTVIKRLEWLDANFLAALNAYVSAAASRNDDVLLNLLTSIRNEVLQQVRGIWTVW